MSMHDIVNEINRLPLDTKIKVVEEVLKSIRKQEVSESMRIASEQLYDDYANDSELTAFTSLDFENFYETK
jgi:hypothetical protein